MGIRFFCPNGHKLNVKAFQAGRRGICPFCGAKFQIPAESTRPASRSSAETGNGTAERNDSGEAGAESTFEQRLDAHLRDVEVAAVAGTPDQDVAASPGESAVAVSAAPGSPTPEPMPSESADSPSSVGIRPKSEPAPDPADAVSIETQPAAATPAPPQAPAMPDPFSEAPNAVWYVRPPSGGQFGPAPVDMMRSWLNEGRVSPETLVWCEGWPDWREAGSVFPQLGATGESMAAPPIASVSGNETASYRAGARHRKSGAGTGLIIFLGLAIVLLLTVLVLILTGVLPRGSEATGEAALNVSISEASVEADWPERILS